MVCRIRPDAISEESRTDPRWGQWLESLNRSLGSHRDPDLVTSYAEIIESSKTVKKNKEATTLLLLRQPVNGQSSTVACALGKNEFVFDPICKLFEFELLRDKELKSPCYILYLTEG